MRVLLVWANPNSSCFHSFFSSHESRDICLKKSMRVIRFRSFAGEHRDWICATRNQWAFFSIFFLLRSSGTVMRLFCALSFLRFVGVGHWLQNQTAIGRRALARVWFPSLRVWVSWVWTSEAFLCIARHQNIGPKKKNFGLRRAVYRWTAILVREQSLEVFGACCCQCLLPPGRVWSFRFRECNVRPRRPG